MPSIPPLSLALVFLALIFFLLATVGAPTRLRFAYLPAGLAALVLAYLLK